MKIILGIIALIIGVRVLTITILSSVLVQILYMCKRISINVRSEILFSKNLHPTETSQPICFANQLISFFTIQVLTKEYFGTDFRVLLTVMSYSQMTYKSNYNRLYIQNKLIYQKEQSKTFPQNKHLLI